VIPRAADLPGPIANWIARELAPLDSAILSAPDGRPWPIATDDALTANRRFRGIADMDGFSSRNDL